MNEKEIPHIINQFKRFGIKPHSLPNAIGMWPNEQECLAWCALNVNPNHNFMEIGSFCGGSAVLLALCKRLTSNKPNSIYSVDCDFEKYQAMSGSQAYSNDKAMAMFEYNVYKIGKFNDLCKQLVCYSDDIPKHYTVKFFNEEQIGFLFIDGFHSFAQVVKDFTTVKPFLAEDAIVAFHDVSPEIKERLNDEVDFESLFKSTTEDFRLDEAINYILKNNKDFTFLDIPVKRNIRHFKETHLTNWVRGTTSPFNSFAAIRRTNES